MPYSELEKKRKVALLKVCVLIIFQLALLSLFFVIGLNSDTLKLLITINMISFFVVFCVIDTMYVKFEKEVKQNLIQNILENILQNDGCVTWSEGGDEETENILRVASNYIDEDIESILRDAGNYIDDVKILFSCYEDSHPREVYLGIYKNQKFKLAEYHIIRGVGRNKYIFLRGNVIKIPLKNNYSGQIVVGKRKLIARQPWEHWFNFRLKRIKINKIFTNGRNLYSNGIDNFDEILTPCFVEFVNSLPKKCQVSIVNNNLYIIYSTNRDTFKLGSLWRKIDDPKQYERFRKDLFYALDIVERASKISIVDKTL